MGEVWTDSTQPVAIALSYWLPLFLPGSKNCPKAPLRYAPQEGSFTISLPLLKDYKRGGRILEDGGRGVWYCWDMKDTIKDLNAAAKAAFGSDIIAMLARCPAFGHKDCCMIFMGKNHAKAAKAFLTKVSNATHAISRNEFDGVVSETSTVVWA